MSIFKTPKLTPAETPAAPNAPRQANTSVIASGTGSRAGDAGVASLISTSPTGVSTAARTTRKRQTLGGA